MAATFTNKWQTLLGDRYIGFGYITHDGSDTTVVLPLGVIDTAIVLPQYGTNSTGVTVSWATNVITVSAAGLTGLTDYVLYIGV
jgi:hypothetical protein